MVTVDSDLTALIQKNASQLYLNEVVLCVLLRLSELAMYAESEAVRRTALSSIMAELRRAQSAAPKQAERHEWCEVAETL